MPRNWVWCGLATVLVAAPIGPALANLAMCAKLVDEGRIYDQGRQIDAKTLVQGAICDGSTLSFAAAINCFAAVRSLPFNRPSLSPLAVYWCSNANTMGLAGCD